MFMWHETTLDWYISRQASVYSLTMRTCVCRSWFGTRQPILWCVWVSAFVFICINSRNLFIKVPTTLLENLDLSGNLVTHRKNFKMIIMWARCIFTEFYINVSCNNSTPWLYSLILECAQLIISAFNIIIRQVYGRAVKGLDPESEGPGSSSETFNFLTNSSGQVTNACMSLFTKQCKLVPAG